MINIKLRKTTSLIQGIFGLLQDSPAFFEEASI